MDKASVSEAEDCGFESRRGYKSFWSLLYSFFLQPLRTLNLVVEAQKKKKKKKKKSLARVGVKPTSLRIVLRRSARL